MFYYKAVNNGIITQIGSGSKPTKLYTEITEEKHAELLLKMQSKPEDTLDMKYVLKDTTEAYEGVATTHEEKVNYYFNAVQKGTMTLEEVPEEYRAEVEAKLPTPTEPTYTLDEAATILAQEVSA